MSLPSKSEISSKNPAAGGEIFLAAGVAALGLFLLLGISDIPFGVGYDRIGPRFFPYAVASGLIVLGVLLALGAFRGAARQRDGSEMSAAPARLNWTALGILALALILSLGLLDGTGFIVACSLQFWLVARAFHSRRPVRDAIVAGLLSSVVYFAFSNLLGLTLPAGILENLF